MKTPHAEHRRQAEFDERSARINDAKALAVQMRREAIADAWTALFRWLAGARSRPADREIRRSLR
jgi:hypothetical protein